MFAHTELEPARPLDPGMGVAIGRRTVFRPEDNEDMFNVAARVAIGNTSLAPGKVTDGELTALRNHIARGGLITSGRHLQHGDEDQATRNMELFTNCSTAPTSFGLFYLLLNGSGVGRSYDDDMMVVDWRYAPKLIVVLDQDHPDYPKTPQAWFKVGKEFGLLPFDAQLEDFTPEARLGVQEWFELNISRTRPDFEHTYFRVPDSREGWAQGLELYETMAYRRRHNEWLVLDFSDVREEGAPIKGMQDRPASGPLSVMRAFINTRNKVVTGAALGLDRLMERPWYQAMHIDHFFSVEVQVGGARRAARMSTKSWLDPDILDFIRIKVEHGLWTSNNSVISDEDFWSLVHWGRICEKKNMAMMDPEVVWAMDVFNTATECSYHNGEPGFINADRLDGHTNGKAREREVVRDGSGFASQKFAASYAKDLLAELSVKAKAARYPMITNPCGEIPLHVEGGYCVLADVAPVNEQPERGQGTLKDWDDRVEEAARLAVRFLMRVNLMDNLYHHEVDRTQRIGVSLTGIHEWAWSRFGYNFRDILDDKYTADWWSLVKRISDATKDEARNYAAILGVNVPHTVTTIKPAGTTSKLYGLSEGAHLPAMAQYLRWNQFRGWKNPDGQWHHSTDPVLIEYEKKGYPVRNLETFPGMSIVGFPTIPLITRLGLGDLLVTAPQATPEEHYRYLQLLEKYWLGEEQGNQVSYTLKIYTTEHSLNHYKEIVAKYQPTIRCCAVMPCKPESEMGYEYLPEEEVDPVTFQSIVAAIDDSDLNQSIDLNTLACASGACPI